MSDIPRYRPVSNDKYGIADDVDGKLCEYRDYARLKAEVERLTNCKSEADRLKAEVERLRKAGDMCDQLLACFEMEGRKGVNVGRDMWRAAKEGKP